MSCSVERDARGPEGVTRVEQFEAIRRDHAREGLSIRELARRHGVHRRAVRQALESPVPPPKRSPQGRPAPALGAFRDLIDEWLRADREAPRKQRHTARRVWQRLVEEHGAVVSERQVARYVRARRRELGEVDEAFVPLVSEAGVEAEVDWGQATVLMGSEPLVVHLFLMRACFSGAAFVITSLEGFLLTPWLTSRAARMNAVAIFIGLLFWGWVWNVWGMLLAVPMLMVIKAVCDHVEDFKAVGELLGD